MIKLKNLTEKLEQLSPYVYATDSAVEVSNWILNKPKPYRISYLENPDIWIIGDANNVIHSMMHSDVFHTGYILDYARNIPQEILDFALSKRVSDKEIEKIAEQLGACDGFFVPSDLDFDEYEDRYYYTSATPITTGEIVTVNRKDFSPIGAWKDLYNKLDRQGAIVGESDIDGFLAELADECSHTPRMTKEQRFERFTAKAKKQGATDEEINAFHDAFV